MKHEIKREELEKFKEETDELKVSVETSELSVNTMVNIVQVAAPWLLENGEFQSKFEAVSGEKGRRDIEPSLFDQARIMVVARYFVGIHWNLIKENWSPLEGEDLEDDYLEEIKVDDADIQKILEKYSVSDDNDSSHLDIEYID